MALRTQPANSLPQRGKVIAQRRLRWSVQLSRRLAFYWLMISTLVAAANVGIAALLLRGDAGANWEGMAFNVATLIAATAVSTTIGKLWPGLWRRAMVAALLAPMALLIVTSGNIAAGAAVAALLSPMVLLGRLLTTLIDSSLDTLDAWVIGATLGVGAIGLLGLILGVSESLRPQFVWPILIIVALGSLFIGHRQLQRDLGMLASWLRRPMAPRLVLLLLAGITLGNIWLNLIGALAPEIRPDAVRQRLATSVHFASNGSVTPTDPDLSAANQPALGEIIFAVPIAIGPVQGAKILQWLVSLGCAAAVFAVGRRLGGKWAGAIAAFAFYQTLLVSYVSQTAYLDHFSALFIVVAVLCLTIGGGTKWRLTICAGICVGLSVATKLHSGYIAIGIAATAIIFAQRYGWFRSFLHATLLTTAAMLTAMPWFARSYSLSKTVPGVGIATTSLAGGGGGTGQLLTDSVTYGYGRDFTNLLVAPLSTIISGRGYGGSDLAPSALVGGHIGYLLLGLVPLLLLLRPRRGTLAIAAGAVIALLCWFYTFQYLRHTLPMIALLCAVGATAFMRTWRISGSRHSRITLNVLLVALALMGTFANVTLPATAQRLAFGLESKDAYLAEWLGTTGAGSYTVMRLLEQDPGATRVFALHDGARLYSHARISNHWTTGANLAIEGTDEQVLALLQAGGYSHIMVDRMAWWSNMPWDRMTVVNEDFLRRNAELIGGDQNSYLYRLVAPERRGSIAWTTGNELIPNSSFELAGNNAPEGWVAIGSPQQDNGGMHSNTGTSAVLLTAHDQLFTQVAVNPDTQYLLAHATRAATANGGAFLTIEWRDRSGNLISTDRENIPVASSYYHTLSMLATAPANAATATIYAQVFHGEVWFDDFSLRVAALP